MAYKNDIYDIIYRLNTNMPIMGNIETIDIIKLY